MGGWWRRPSSPDDSTDGYTSDFNSSSWAWTSALWNVHCFLHKILKASCTDKKETVFSSDDLLRPSPTVPRTILRVWKRTRFIPDLISSTGLRVFGSVWMWATAAYAAVLSQTDRIMQQRNTWACRRPQQILGHWSSVGRRGYPLFPGDSSPSSCHGQRRTLLRLQSCYRAGAGSGSWSPIRFWAELHSQWCCHIAVQQSDLCWNNSTRERSLS